MQSHAATVEQYLASLPSDRREAMLAVREVIRANLDPDIEEGMAYGMIGYCVPHRVFPDGYHCDPKQPLPYASLASQKNHMALYLMSVYADDANDHAAWFREAWAQTGKKLDMGKSCIRFRRVEDLALDVIAEAFRRITARAHVDSYVAARDAMASRSGSKSAARAKPARGPAAKAPVPKRAAAGKPPRGVKKPAASNGKAATGKPASRKAAPKKAAPKKAAARAAGRGARGRTR